MQIPKYFAVEVMQILDFSVFIRPNFPLSLYLKLINITFDLDEFNINFKFIKNSFNDCQPKTIGFRVSTSSLGHLHG